MTAHRFRHLTWQEEFQIPLAMAEDQRKTLLCHVLTDISETPVTSSSAVPLGIFEPTAASAAISPNTSVFVALIVTTVTAAQKTVFFPTEDGGRVCADVYGAGTRAAVLALGGRFTTESWHEQAEVLAHPRALKFWR